MLVQIPSQHFWRTSNIPLRSFMKSVLVVTKKVQCFKTSTSVTANNMRQLRSSHSSYDQLYPAVTINECDSYDQFVEIFSSRNLQYPTLLLRFLTTKKSICPMTQYGRRTRCRVDTIRDCVQRPPFWFIVTAVGCKLTCYLPVITLRTKDQSDQQTINVPFFLFRNVSCKQNNH